MDKQYQNLIQTPWAYIMGKDYYPGVTLMRFASYRSAQTHSNTTPHEW